MIIMPRIARWAYRDWKRWDVRDCRHGPIVVEKIGPKLWQFHAPCLFAWTCAAGAISIMIPAGYRDDGASIPARFRDVVDPEAAFAGSHPHDIGYETCGGERMFRVWDIDGQFRLQPLIDWTTGERLRLPRELWDAVLREFWLVSGMDEDAAQLGYAAVRAFGQAAWESVEPDANAMLPVSQWAAA